MVAGNTGNEAVRGLAMLNLHPGEAVRWRTAAGGRWHLGVVTRRENDGSVGVTDRDGRARSLPVERLEVALKGRRGGHGWEPLTTRASRCEQLDLLSLLG